MRSVTHPVICRKGESNCRSCGWIPNSLAFAILALFFIAGLHIMWTADAEALTTVDLTDGGSTFINISQKDLNLIRTPWSPGLKIYTSSKALDVKVVDKDVFVQYLEGMAPAPQEIFLVTARGTFSLVLVPKSIPGETIIVRTPENSTGEAAKWEESSDYVSGLKDLIKAMYEGSPPIGFSLSKSGKDVTAMEGTRQVITEIYKGATLEGEVSTLVNLSKESLELAENQFYRRGVLAVSIDSHEVPPMGQTTLYLIKKTGTQEAMERSMSRMDPLDNVRTGRR
jgi:conjugal transfer pilus assembly protein TraK